jgi:DNA-binding CsgD family transcriptional regulator
MTSTNAENALLAAVEQLTNLVAIAMTRDMRQVEAIELLSRSSLSNGQIAAILGTTQDTVRNGRNRLKRDAAKAPAKASAKKGPSNDTVGE